jgi:threonine dehydrogenase-like Zn-dependent dehydrogenase
MRATVLHKPGDVRFEERPAPTILTPTDAIIQLSATCVCGSDLWPYRGMQEVTTPSPMGHEYCGIVEEVGGAVTSLEPGQFVVHASRQKLAREYGSTDIVTERGADGVARIKDLTKGVGADEVLECVGTQESMQQAIGAPRPGGHVSYVGVPHGVNLDGQSLFFTHVHLHGGPAPVRRFLPQLMDLVWSRNVDPAKVFDLTLPLEQVAEGYRAMDERRAIKALLRP